MSTEKVEFERVPEKYKSRRVSKKGPGEYREGWIRARTEKGRILESAKKVEILASTGKVESGRVLKR